MYLTHIFKFENTSVYVAIFISLNRRNDKRQIQKGNQSIKIIFLNNQKNSIRGKFYSAIKIGQRE